MALQKTVIPTNLAMGLDTKTSKFQTSGYLQLQNCFQQKTGSIQKRFGLTSLSNSVYGNNPFSNITSGYNLFKFNEELLMHDGENLFSYNPVNENWVYSNQLFTNVLNSSPVVINTFSQSIPTVAYNNNLELHAWEDARGGVYATVVEQSTGNIIFPAIQLSSDYSLPKAIACGNNLFLFVIKGGNQLVSISINTNNPTSFSSENIISSSISTSNLSYDIDQLNSGIVFAFGDTSDFLNVGYVASNNVVGSPITGFPSPIIYNTISVTTAISLATSMTNVFIAVCNGTGIQHVGLNGALAIIYPLLTIAAGDATTLITLINDGNVNQILYQITASPNVNSYIKHSLLTLSTNTSSVADTFAVGAGLLTNIFLANGMLFVGVVYDTNLQSTYFLLSVPDGVIVSKFAYGLGGGLIPDPNSLANVVAVPVPNTSPVEYVYEFDAAVRVNITQTSLTSVSFVTGINKYAFNFSPFNVIQSQQLGGNLHISGGFIQAYDGISSVELGFLLNPELPVLTTGSGALSGTYQYVVVWEWIDQDGQLHQSGSSPIATTSVLSSNNVTLTIKTLNFTFKQPQYQRTNVLGVIYRTLSNGTIFYRVTSVTSPLYNDPTANTITYLDNASDASINGNELLYTTGGVLPNYPTPSATSMQVFQNRLFVIQSEYPNLIFYSKEFLPTEGISFAAQNYQTIDETGGSPVSLNSLDDKLVIFKNNRTYVTSGSGPDDTGQNGGFAVPQLISGDIGCIAPSAIVRIPNGLMFVSSKGIYLLSRSLTFEYIGAPVEDFNSLTFTSAVVVPDYNQARFVTSEGTTLVYDWFFGQWYTYINQSAIASVIWNNKFLILNLKGIVRQEIENTYSDDGNPIQTIIRTPWYSFAGLQGYQRLYSVLILGEYAGEHVLTTSSYYDFDPSPTETVSINTTAIVQGAIWGSSDIWGTNPPWGGLVGRYETYQFEYKPARQKCESVQFVIKDNFPTSLPTAGFKLHALSFVVGVKVGQQKMPAVRRMT